MTNQFLPVSRPDLQGQEEEYLLNAFRSGWISSAGDFVKRFEQLIASRFEAKHAVCVSNGTVALHLALVAAGIGPGDEVIVPAFTFVATAAAVLHAGAIPVFVDSEPDIGTLDPKAVEKAIGPKTKAIIAVHLYGHPADMAPINEVASAKNLTVIEDAAEAHGARYRGRCVGSVGHLATFSFYGNKILTTGEGGAVTTSDYKLAERLRHLRDHAMDSRRRYWHCDVGFNYRLTNLQAAIGCAQIERLDAFLAKRAQIAERYRFHLKGVPNVVINPRREWAEPVNWLTTLTLSSRCSGTERDALIAHLAEQGIDSRPFFFAIPDLPPYKDFREVGIADGRCNNARDLAARGLNLPTFNELTEPDVKRVASAIRSGLAVAQ